MNTNYEKDFVPYEQALELKKLGWGEPCFGAFISKDLTLFTFPNEHRGYVYKKNRIIGAPTFSQAFRWFREKHLIFSSILPFQDIEDNVGLCYYYCVIELYECSGEDILCNETSLGASDSNFPSPEEAELECLKKLIEIVKKQL